MNMKLPDIDIHIPPADSELCKVGRQDRPADISTTGQEDRPADICRPRGQAGGHQQAKRTDRQTSAGQEDRPADISRPRGQAGGHQYCRPRGRTVGHQQAKRTGRQTSAADAGPTAVQPPPSLQLTAARPGTKTQSGAAGSGVSRSMCGVSLCAAAARSGGLPAWAAGGGQWWAAVGGRPDPPGPRGQHRSAALTPPPPARPVPSPHRSSSTLERRRPKNLSHGASAVASWSARRDGSGDSCRSRDPPVRTALDRLGPDSVRSPYRRPWPAQR